MRPGETISSHGLDKRAGGKGANQAVAAARAGARTTLIGAIGEDGRWVVDQLKRYGVDVTEIDVVQVYSCLCYHRRRRRLTLLFIQGSTGRAIIQLTRAGENSISKFSAPVSSTRDSIFAQFCTRAQITHLSRHDQYLRGRATFSYKMRSHSPKLLRIFQLLPIILVVQFRPSSILHPCRLKSN